MSVRSIGAIAAFLLVFLGLMAMVGNVHVAEFFVSLALGFIAACSGQAKPDTFLRELS